MPTQHRMCCRNPDSSHKDNSTKVTMNDRTMSTDLQVCFAVVNTPSQTYDKEIATAKVAVTSQEFTDLLTKLADPHCKVDIVIDVADDNTTVTGHSFTCSPADSLPHPPPIFPPQLFAQFQSLVQQVAKVERQVTAELPAIHRELHEVHELVSRIVPDNLRDTGMRKKG
jgi:hypothetical protein